MGDMRQLTIFDVIEPEKQDWHEMSIKEIASYVGNQTGLNFIPDTRFHGEFKEYIAYYTNKMYFTLGFSHYNTLDDRNGKKFISAGFEDRTNGFSGSGRPCNTLEEVIGYIKRILERTETE